VEPCGFLWNFVELCGTVEFCGILWNRVECVEDGEDAPK
jgi:hypothetical protein